MRASFTLTYTIVLPIVTYGHIFDFRMCHENHHSEHCLGKFDYCSVCKQ